MSLTALFDSPFFPELTPVQQQPASLSSVFGKESTIHEESMRTPTCMALKDEKMPMSSPELKDEEFEMLDRLESEATLQQEAIETKPASPESQCDLDTSLDTSITSNISSQTTYHMMLCSKGEKEKLVKFQSEKPGSGTFMRFVLASVMLH